MVQGFKVQANASKAEEVDFLKKIKGQVEDGTYLASLLTDKLVAWFELKVADDWSTDLYEMYEAALNEKPAVEDAKRVIANLEERLAGVEKQHDQARAQLQEAERQLLALREELTHRRLENDQNIDRLSKEREELMQGYLASQEAIGHLERQVIELKAELYDYIIKGRE